MSQLKKEKFDQPHEFDQYLGQLDMEKHPLWERAWKGQDQEAFEQILHDLGADLSHGYEFNVCFYRPRMSNQPEYGVRVSFKERTDKQWMDTMMDITDVLRNTTGSITRTGMVLSLNNRIQNTFDEIDD